MDTNNQKAVVDLLNQLRNSTAWRETVADGPTSGDHHDQSPSVASLLSLLEPSSVQVPLSLSGQPSTAPQPDPTPPTLPRAPPVRQPPSLSAQDLRSCSFQQALPLLVRLCTPEFVAAVAEMKKEQADLERQLADERRGILQKHEAKVKVAITKANLIGSEGLSQYEADLMSEAFKKDIDNFDRRRVLPAWDGITAKHQAALETLHCPAMYVTNLKADTERQKRVVQVLENLINGETMG